MADQINIGDIYRGTVEFRVGGVLTSPTTVTAGALSPAGVESVLVVVNDGVGLYHTDVAPTEAGIWRYWFTGTGAAAGVESGSFRAEAVPYAGARYSTPGDLRSTLNPTGETDSGTAAVLSEAELADAIARADAEIDGYLAGIYAVPLTSPVPDLVGQISTDLAAYDATLRYRRGVPMDPNDPMRLRAIEARKLLERIGKGAVDLVGLTGQVAQAGSAAVVNLRDPMWTMDQFGLGPGPLPGGYDAWVGRG